jgi:hypothetical protein
MAATLVPVAVMKGSGVALMAYAPCRVTAENDSAKRDMTLLEGW